MERFRDKNMGITHRKLSPALTRFARIARGNDGFTLVELLIVTGIIGVLAFTSIFAVKEFINRTKTSRAAAEIRGLEKDVISFNTEKGRYPDLTEFSAFPGAGDLKDPWGNIYVYAAAPTARFSLDPAEVPPLNSDFTLYSKGANGNSDDSIETDDSQDDIIRAHDGSFVGTAKFYGL